MEKQIGAVLLPGSVFLLILNLALGIEVCIRGTFRANCSSGNVIKIQSALYGRMRSSQCIYYSTTDLDCYANVQPYLEGMCNGHVECSVRASDNALLKAYNGRCLKSLTPYLDVLYTCIHEILCDTINPPADVVVEDIANGHRLSCANDKDISWEVHCVNGTWLPESSRSCATWKPTISSSKPTIPIFKPTIPISKHTISTSKSTIPTSKHIIPTSKPTEPTSKPIIPTSKPTEPTSKPTIPTSNPIVPTSKPTIPPSNPIIPTSKPTIPTSNPIIPTSKPTIPNSKTTMPTSKPEKPTSKRSVPTTKPAITTSKPITVVTPVVKKEMQDGDSSLTKKLMIIGPCTTAALIILLATVSMFIHKRRQRNR